MTSRLFRYWIVAIGLTVLPIYIVGCGPKPVTGGTEGVLRIDGQTVSDLQVNLFRSNGGAFELAGFGVTRDDGWFSLVQPGAVGPLILPPGEYLCTIESAGAPIRLLKEWGKPETTKIKIDWKSSDRHIDLDVDSQQRKAP
jgi:hypothetical protein